MGFIDFALLVGNGYLAAGMASNRLMPTFVGLFWLLCAAAYGIGRIFK